MRRNKFFIFGLLIVLFLSSMSACGTATVAQPTTAPVVPTNSSQPAPTVLNIASIHPSAIEVAWSKVWFEAWGRIAEAKPHGLTINYKDYTENVWGDDAERVLREYASTGKYQIIWAHSSYSDQVKKLMVEFPEILWAVTGSGNEPLGGNAYLIYEHGHEGAYLLGILAGKMTKSNIIGYVGGFPADDVNDALNGFLDGAKSVNPNVEAKYSFIESWYDPPKAKEATLALIAAGADFVYAERLGVFDGCSEKQTLCFGHFEDQNYLAPDVVLSSTTINWQPSAELLLETWWKHETEGTPYNAPMDQVWYSMKEGGVDIAPFHDLADEVPQDALDAMNKAHDEIMAGTLVVPLKTDLPEK
jgi:basic membrane protein A and related proteins